MGELVRLRHPPKRNGRGLSRKQLACLRFVGRFRDDYGRAPSRDEIASAMDLVSQAAVSRVIDPLIERGLLP